MEDHRGVVDWKGRDFLQDICGYIYVSLYMMYIHRERVRENKEREGYGDLVM